MKGIHILKLSDKQREMRCKRFIDKAKQLHVDDDYDYSQVVFVNTHTKVKIICKEHGAFEQTPAKHLSGQGCPGCVNKHREATCMKNFGVRNPRQSQKIADKIHSTVREKYGVDYIVQAKEVREKSENTCMEHYGYRNPRQVPEIAAQIEHTNLERYGSRCVLSVPDIIEKRYQTMQNRYGVKCALQNVMIREKMYESKRINGTFDTSNIEDIMYNYICEYFGIDNVIRQYKSDIYPYRCDFYIKCRDLYIELNASWTHGGHWFNATDVDDLQQLSVWHEKAVISEYYANAIATWTVRDVKKREFARMNKLNYVALWNKNGKDFSLWLDAGCPDGYDWDHVYSWLSL